MFNKWIVLFILTLVFFKINFFFFNKIHLYFIITEFIWITLYVIYSYMSSIFNDPRFLLISFFFLFLAVLEIIVFSLTFNK